MTRSPSLDPLIDEITRWAIGMPVRPMEELLRHGAAAVPPLVALVSRWPEDEGERDLLWPVVLLGDLRAAEAVEPLADLLADGASLELSMAAAEALAKIGAPAVSTLVQRARTGGAEERIRVYAALGWIGDDAAYGALTDALERDDALIDVVALALADLGREDAIPLIHRALERAEPWRRLDLENALRDLAGPPSSPAFRRDWRLRYRRWPAIGMPEPTWPVVAAAVRGRDEVRRERPPLPVRPLEEILAEGPEPDDAAPERCEDCGAPFEEYTAVPACPETAVSTAVFQSWLLERARNEGFDDLFDYLDELDAWQLDLLESDEPNDADARQAWEDDQAEVQVARRTCIWLIEQGVEAVGPGIDRLWNEADRLARRHGDPEGLLRVRRTTGPRRPAARVPDVGRNDPCPCGSGQKYKRCCGAPGRAKADDRGGTRSDRDGADGPGAGLYRRYLEELAEFSARAEFREEARAGLERFAAVGAEPPARKGVEAGTRPGRSGAAIPEESEGLFLDWLLLDYRPDGGPTFLERYLDRRGPRLPERDREFLRRLGSSHVALYEVLEARPGAGLTLRDLVTGATTDVDERIGSRSLVRWDLLGARLVQVGARTQLAAGVLAFPSHERHELADGLKAELGRYRRDHPDASPAAFLKERGAEWLFGRALDLLNRPPPRVVTPEGHDLLFCRARYEVSDREALLAALRAEPELDEHEDEPGEFAWLEPPGEPGAGAAPADGIRFESTHFEFPGAESRRSLGHLQLEEDGLFLECMSRERLERGKALLERCAGRWLRPAGETVEDPGRVMAEYRERGERSWPEPSVLPPDLEAELTHAYFDRHYRSWVDQPIPTLGGLTPREAAREPEGRRRVADLVRGIENHMARERLERGRAYDASWLRGELGLEPDE